jgi:hypothetical protein
VMVPAKIVDSDLLKKIVGAVQIPCQPPGMSEADYIKGAVGLCVLKATAAYSSMFGTMIGGFSMILTQGFCNTKVQDAVITGTAACG